MSMVGHRPWSKDASPAGQLLFPAYIGLITVNKKIGVIQSNLINHLTAVQATAVICAKHFIFMLIISHNDEDLFKRSVQEDVHLHVRPALQVRSVGGVGRIPDSRTSFSLGSRHVRSDSVSQYRYRSPGRSSPTGRPSHGARNRTRPLLPRS